MSRRMTRVIRVDFVNHDFFFHDHCLLVVGRPNRSPDPAADRTADNCTIPAADFRTDSSAGTAADRTTNNGSSVRSQRRAGKTQCCHNYHNVPNVHIRSFQCLFLLKMNKCKLHTCNSLTSIARKYLID